MPSVRDVMKTSLHSVEPAETVGEAVAVMAQHRIGSVLVMQGDRLLGIFTERDTVRALSQAHDAARHEIISWMTHDPKTVAPSTDTEDALRVMLALSALAWGRGLPVARLEAGVAVIVVGATALLAAFPLPA